jgi:hypothetical protein
MLMDLMKEQIYYDYNRGFITKAVHGEIPDHAVSITSEEHSYLLDQANTHNKEIYVENGEVKLRDIEYSYESIADMAIQERSVMLRDSDWTQLPDTPEAIREKYVIYRQKLRDITEQEGFPFNIKWPTLGKNDE